MSLPAAQQQPASLALIPAGEDHDLLHLLRHAAGSQESAAPAGGTPPTPPPAGLTPTGDRGAAPPDQGSRAGGTTQEEPASPSGPLPPTGPWDVFHVLMNAMQPGR